jgi:hypothetical protein
MWRPAQHRPQESRRNRVGRHITDCATEWRPAEDDKLPDSKTCYERAGWDNKVAHTALEDALAVVRLVRLGIKRLEGMAR